jgi:hypothetical protein
MSTIQRDFGVDSLRGLILVIMFTFHLGPPIGTLYPHLVVLSTAEGFVFLSGLVGGMVYGQLGLKQNKSLLRSKVLRRALDIYLYHMIAFILTTLLLVFSRYHAYYLGGMNPLSLKAPATALALGALFLYQPPLFILPMFCLFLLVTPIIIRCFVRKKEVWILLGSFLMWSLATYRSWDSLQRFLFQYFPCSLSIFNPFAWQILFVGGLFFGFRRLSNNTPLIPVNKILLFCSLIVMGGISYLDCLEPPPTIMGFFLPALTLRSSLGPLALINFAAEVYILTYVGVRFQQWLKWPFLSFIGRHSLQVFFFHLLLLFAILPLYLLIIPLGWTVVIFTNILLVGILALPAWIHLKYQKLKK